MAAINTEDVMPWYTTIAWGGDVNIGRRFHYAFHEHGAGEALAGIAALREADLGIVNLECVVSTAGEIGIEKNERASYYYRARPEMVEVLVNGGVDMVATANNHSGDYGPDALMEQANWLDSAGIGHAGSGQTLAHALRPVIRSAGKLNVALFSLDATQASFAASDTHAGHAYLSLSQPQRWREILTPLIADARSAADIVLVAVHWGENNRTAPGKDEIAVGHAIIDSGADAVLGASAHMLQAIEIYRDRPIIHDAGDLLFDAIRRDDKESGVFTLGMDRSGVRRVTFTPLEVGFCKTVPLTEKEAQSATGRYAEKCAVLGTALHMEKDGTGVLELDPPDRNQTAKVNPALPHPQPVSLEFLPRADWVVDIVPQEARLPQSRRLGPLELLGVTMSPVTLDARGLVFVESYWRLAQETEENWRIDFKADASPASIGIWGVACDHDPCDWMWPTSQWNKDTIYRDRYALRPPAIRRWLDGTLKLSVGLRSKDKRTERVKLPVETRFVLSPKEAFAVLRANPPQYRVPPKEKIAPVPQVLWSAEQLEQITGGKWLTRPPKYWYVGSVSHKSNTIFGEDMPEPRLYVAIDKRLAARHELYSDLAGRHWDSHNHLVELQHKLNGSLVARVPEGVAPSFPLMLVDDPLHALMQLGVVGRQRLQGRVVAITGSAGKTSLASMLTRSMSVDKQVRSNSSNNYNSRVGLLHLLANTLPSVDLVVMEVAVSAINAPGFQNIKLVRPDIAVVTNIAPSHLPPGKGLGYIAQRKANIFEGMTENGWVVIYRETAYFDYLSKRARQRGLNIMSYGQSEDADIRLDDYDLVSGTVRASLQDGHSFEYKLTASGLHMALNSLACIAVRRILGDNVETFLPALALFQSAPGRGQTSPATFMGKKITIIDEAYNANPLSMRMALSLMQTKAEAGRNVLILGDMLELGDEAFRYHLDLVEPILSLHPDCVLMCGDLMRHLWDAMSSASDQPINGRWYESAERMIDEIDMWMHDGDRVLIKGSNSMGLGALVERLTAEIR